MNKFLFKEGDLLVCDTEKGLLKVGENGVLVTTNLKQNINQMFGGEHINSTENRSVFHVALRAPRDTFNSKSPYDLNLGGVG
ncbi:hypothetical protein F8388_016049 [Cannabis sativa]|uniref:Uncharacterized protein n=1 Tax=Cannabis sativa TaxID=3483 RepID=A0A7J6FV07_CANSA|nr:hypothetical protein F8388_016049 [Cannabis sativa]